MPWRTRRRRQAPPDETRWIDGPPLSRVNKTYLQETPLKSYEVASRSIEVNDTSKWIYNAAPGRKILHARNKLGV